MMTTSLSRKILIWIMVLFAILLLEFFGALPNVAGWINNFVGLRPARIYPGWELWRLVLYPAGVSLLGLFVGSIVFSTPAEELESMQGTRQFGLQLLLLVLMAGLMHLMMFFGDETPEMVGLENLALFVLVGYVYLFPQSDVRIFFFSLKSWLLLAICSAIVVGQTVMGIIYGANPFLFFSYGGFGLLVGAAYFHARYQKYPFLLRPIRRLERAAERATTHSSPRTPAPARRASGNVAVRNKTAVQRPVQRELSDEERLNVILDRISEKGYESLSDEEQRFLRDYSDRL